MTTIPLTRNEIEEIVVGNALKHTPYREALLKNPKKVIETQLNNKLPEGLNVKVIEESGDTIYVRLPHRVTEGSELSDADLEQVAGGKGFGSDDTQTTTYNCNNARGGFNTRNEFSSEVSLL
ncbi:MAG: NHLP leader peptide family RiPP precursor [Verrucomicrobiales bacterium]